MIPSLLGLQNIHMTDHYNMTATIEALCFLELYPQCCEELARRIREGRICVSPFLCNTLLALTAQR